MPRYALIVGIGQYQALPPLSKPEGDARTVHDLLKRGDFTDIDLKLNPTFEQLNSALETLLHQRADRSDALIYFTGHGFTAGETDDDQEGYLATADCQVEMDGRIFSQRRALSFKRLNGLIARANLSSLVMLLDCCHSGYLIEDGLVKGGLGAFRERNYCLIAACRGFEQAYAERAAPHSLFTTALVAGLGADPASGDITALELFRAVQTQLKGVGQEPILLNSGQDITVLRLPRRVEAPNFSDDCPYQGLMAFDKATKDVFFGREAEVGDLVRRLDGANFVPVIGASGSGKSSVVRAGLLPWAEGQSWQVLGPIKPGPEPMAELKSSFRTVFDNREIGTIYQLIDGEGLVGVLEHLPQGQRYLLVVDQFEEVFTVCTDRDQRQRFIHSLTGLSQRAEAAIKVVTTMRSDFVTTWLSSDPLTQAIQYQAVWLGTLRGEALRQAIASPAEKHGYGLEPGLLELILDDVDAEENCLPLLEFALAELWQRRDTQRRVLTASAYRALGRLRGALSQRADALYQALKTDLERDWCRRLCLELVRIGPEGTDTRSRQPRQTLVDKGNTPKAQETITQVLDTLVEGRLLVADRVDDSDTIDLAHESLMAGWPTFAQWRDENRDQRRLVQRLKDAYAEWQAKDRNNGYLVQGGLLAELRDNWTALKTEAKLAAGLTDFFSLSDDHEQQQVAALEKALAEAELRAECSRIANLPSANAVDKTLLTIKAVADSLNALQGEVIAPVQDALHRAFTHPCERLRIENNSSRIFSVAFSPIGNCIVSGGDDGTLRLWNLQGQQIGKSFEGHTGWVWSVACSPMGNCIVSGGDDGTLRLWNFQGQQIGKPFEGHTGLVRAVTFSARGDCIISGGEDGTLRLWNLHGRQLGRDCKGHSKVFSAACSPAGDCIVSGGDDGVLRLWDFQGQQIGKPFEGHTGWIRSVAFSPRGDRIVSIADDCTLRLWDLDGRQLSTAHESHNGGFFSVAFSPRGDCVVSGGDDGTLRLWDLDGQQIGSAFEGHSDWVLSVAFSSLGNHLASGSEDGTLRLWDLEGRQIQIDSVLERHRGLVFSVAFSPTGDHVASSSDDGTLRLWDAENCQISSVFKDYGDTVRSVAFSPNGDCIVSGGADATLRLWNLEGQQISEAFKGHLGRVWSVAFSPSGNSLASGGDDGTLRLWDIENRQIKGVLKGHSNGVRSVAFSPRGNYVVSGGDDGTLRLWDIEGRQILRVFAGHVGAVLSVAWNPAGNRIVSGGEDSTLRLWDLEGRQIGVAFAGHSGEVWSVVFSPKGEHIVSGGNDGTLRLWDLEGRQIGGIFAGHVGAVLSVAFSPGGGHIVSGGYDGTLRLWPGGRWQDWLHTCCSRLMHHPRFTQPTNDIDRQACQVCQDYVWTEAELAEFRQAQAMAQGNDS